MVYSARARILTFGAAVLLVLSLVQAGQALSARPAGPRLLTLRLDYFAGNMGRLARSLDPAHASYPADVATIQMANAGLVRLLPNGRVVPDLATWQVNKDHLVYTFTLRPNARFSNGHPVTANDAAFSIQRALAPSTSSDVATTYLGAIRGALKYSLGQASRISGLQVVGRRVLRVTLVKPLAYFLQMLAYPTADVLDPRVLRFAVAAQTSNFLTNHCSGNQGAGPFMFTCWNDGPTWAGFYPRDQLPAYTLVPNPYYFGPKPRLRVQLAASRTVQASYEAYLAGKVDTTPVPSQEVPRWRGNSKQYREYRTSTIVSLVPNMHMAPLSDLHCRLAMAYGIDRASIARRIPDHAAAPIYGLVPPGLPGYGDGGSSLPLNLARAQSELRKCGSRRTPLKLVYAVDPPEGNGVYTTVVDQLRRVGFDASPNAVTAGNIGCWCGCMDLPLDKCKVQLVRSSWRPDFPDAQSFVTRLLRCGQYEDIGSWCNSTFDRLVDRADVEQNPAQRARLYFQAERLALSKGARIPLIEMYAHELIRPYVHGLVGTVVSPELLPKDGDWSRVSIAGH